MEKYLDLKNDKDYTKIKEASKIINNGGLDTVGIRMPSNEIAKWLIEYANTPIAAPNSKCMLIYIKVKCLETNLVSRHSASL